MSLIQDVTEGSSVVSDGHVTEEDITVQNNSNSNEYALPHTESPNSQPDHHQPVSNNRTTIVEPLVRSVEDDVKATHLPCYREHDNYPNQMYDDWICFARAPSSMVTTESDQSFPREGHSDACKVPHGHQRTLSLSSDNLTLPAITLDVAHIAKVRLVLMNSAYRRYMTFPVQHQDSGAPQHLDLNIPGRATFPRNFVQHLEDLHNMIHNGELQTSVPRSVSFEPMPTHRRNSSGLRLSQLISNDTLQLPTPSQSNCSSSVCNSDIVGSQGTKFKDSSYGDADRVDMPDARSGSMDHHHQCSDGSPSSSQVTGVSLRSQDFYSSDAAASSGVDAGTGQVQALGPDLDQLIKLNQQLQIQLNCHIRLVRRFPTGIDIHVGADGSGPTPSHASLTQLTHSLTGLSHPQVRVLVVAPPQPRFEEEAPETNLVFPVWVEHDFPGVGEGADTASSSLVRT